MKPVEEAKKAALEVLLHNARGPFHSLPRAAGWGYPEPYTRDLMISALGILACGDQRLVAALRATLQALAANQTDHGHITSLAHDPHGRGASDTTPLFLMALALFRRTTGEKDFLEEAAQKSLTWMEYQSPVDRVIVGQLPTTDWRDEQWVLGYGLYVNAVVHLYLQLFGRTERADALRRMVNRFLVAPGAPHQKQGGLAVPHRPHFALWSHKIHGSDRVDLLGNSLAIISGLASAARARALVRWIEEQSQIIRQAGELAVELPPNLFPYIRPTDPDWMPRYQIYGQPGEYHNGGVWPFICGFYVVAVLAAGFPRLAQKKLEALTRLVRPACNQTLTFGFNEWIKAQDGTPRGQDWQTWSAASYLYAAACVEQKRVLFFDDLPAVRNRRRFVGSRGDGNG